MAEHHPHHTFGEVAHPDTPIALVDLDGVFFGMHQRIAEVFHDRHPHLQLLPFEECRSFYIEDDHPEHYGPLLWDIVREPGFFATLPIIEGAVDGIRELSELAEVFICTAPMNSNPTCMADKVASVTAALGKEWATRIVIAKDKTLVRGTCLIDDRPRVDGKLTPHWEHWIFDQPYNRSFPGRRVVGWEGVVSMAHAEWRA